MQATLYKMSDDKRKLNKTLTSPLNVDLLFKDNCDLLEPSLEMAYFDNYVDYNYLYIPSLKRYFYIDNSTIELGSLVLLKCSVDVLMSWQTNIKALGGITSRMTGNNILVSDPKMKLLSKTNIVQHNFIGGEMLKSIGSANHSIVLNVIGR